ncbi:hypothetical protein TNCV_1924571 [Trichonephila clavipes]|nr:hypothetical protein TNCV_1924571 [Trichonephila clavipes]
MTLWVSNHRLNLNHHSQRDVFLSESSKIFDPLGLLSPCTVFMKIFYQKLWLTKTDWDSPIPQQLTERIGLSFKKAFNAINYLTVPQMGHPYSRQHSRIAWFCRCFFISLCCCNLLSAETQRQK